MAEQLQSIISIWKASGAAHQTLWTFFIVVVSAVLGFSFSKSYRDLPKTVRRALLFLLGLFLATNALSLWNNLAIYNTAILELAKLCDPQDPLYRVVTEIERIPRLLVIAAHIVLSICALFMVWKAGRLGGEAPDEDPG